MFAEPAIDNEFKVKLLQETVGDEKSDIVENVVATCMSLMPAEERKAKVWGQITDLNSQESLFVKTARMEGFYNFKQMEMIRPYFDEFFKALKPLYYSFQFQFVESFVANFLPLLEIKDAHIVKLYEIKLDTPDSEVSFMKLID